MDVEKLKGKRIFELINGKYILGEYEVITEGDHAGNVKIINPFTTAGGKLMPYGMETLPNAPAAIQLHPMNILWSVSLDEFPKFYDAYIEITTGLVTSSEAPKIIT